MRSLALVLALALLAGCGFQLRGEREALSLQVRSMYLETGGAPLVATELREQLAMNEVKLVQDRAAAELLVSLSGERFATRVLSVDPETGKVREYELDYQARLSVRRADGRTLIDDQGIELQRDFTFDETAVLGKFGEESEIRLQMLREAADNVLRRLEALELEPRAG